MQILKDIKVKLPDQVKDYLGPTLLLLFFFTEAFSKIKMFSGLEKSMIPMYLKGLCLVFSGGFLLLKNYKSLIGIFILGLVFCLGQWTLKDNFNFEIITSFSKYLFLILLIEVFNQFKQSYHRKLFLNTFEYLVSFNALLAIIGFIGSIHIFKNYHGIRFGYNGLLISSATATYFFIISLCYFLVRYKETVYKNWRFWLVVTACILQGTKSTYLALAAFIIFYILYFVKSKLTKYAFISLVSIGILVFGYYLFYINPIFSDIRSSDGILTSVLSLRDQLFVEQTLPFIQENWGSTNYLFGGISDLSTRTQMMIVDIFYFWGIIGGLLFLYFFSKSYITFNIKSSIVIFCLFVITAIAVLSGNFFFNASVVIYLLLLRETFLYTENHSISH